MTVFVDRADAGRRLAAALAFVRHEDPVVIGVPRGGVVVAAEVARGLCATVDVAVVRRLEAPGRTGLTVGAVGEGGIVVHEQHVLDELGVAGHDLAEARRRADAEVADRARRWRPGRRRTPLAGRVVVLVDDGMATGATMRTACRVVRAEGARRVVVAAPVASAQAVERLADLADEMVVLSSPAAFASVGEWYGEYGEVRDDDVIRVLTEGPSGRSAHEVCVPVPGGQVVGRLTLPPDACGVVVFAHGSGSGRSSRRNARIAEELCHLGLGTVLLDLLTPAERAADAVVGVEELGSRLVAVARWLAQDARTAGLPVGLFGAGSGGAAALVAATRGEATGGEVEIAAVVSRGGLLDLAGSRLAAVTAPTLLVVGGDDADVLRSNEEAQGRLGSVNELVVVPGAGHLFEEPGTLDTVSRVTSQWFTERLARSRA